MNVDRVLGSTLNEREAFTKFIEAIRIAESSARQLAYVRNQPRWLIVENGLAGMREVATKMAQAPGSRLII